MLRIHICEDDTKQRERVQQLIVEVLEIEKLNMEIGIVTDNPADIIQQIQKEEENGVFFLDIDLQHQINGLELAKQIREHQPRCYIIFVTTHSEMSYMTFTYKVEAMDFIIKDEYKEMKNRIYQCLLHAQKLEAEKIDVNKVKTFSVKVGSRVQEIPLEEILYFEVSDTPHKLILHKQDAIIEFFGKIKELENELDERFYRCHRSCIVNKDNIKEIDEVAKILRLKNGAECPISVRLGKGLKK